MSLLQKLKAGTNNRKTIKWPGTEEDIIVRVLSEAERQSASFETERLFKQQGIEISMSTVDVYEVEKTTQLLFRALSDTENKPVADSINEFRDNITVTEKDILVDAYNELEAECSPDPGKMSDEAFNSLIEDLKKNPAQTISSVSSMRTAIRLITYLANLLQSLQQDNGSTST